VTATPVRAQFLRVKLLIRGRGSPSSDDRDGGQRSLSLRLGVKVSVFVGVAVGSMQLRPFERLFHYHGIDHIYHVHKMLIRDAVESDFTAITAIYNDVLLNTTAIYNDQPATVNQRLELWKARLQQGSPTLVACDDESVFGFASFGDFRSWPGYRFTVEHTVHVGASSRGQGIGSGLLRALIPRAAALGKHVMVGGIDADNLASLRFHERLGFERVAHFKQVGFKFGRFLDLVFVQLMIKPAERAISPDQK